MPDDRMSSRPTGTEALGKGFLIGFLIFSAIAIAAIGTMVPIWLEFEQPLATWVRLIFYAAAVGDLAIALWFRSRLKKARPPKAASGTVQRQ